MIVYARNYWFTWGFLILAAYFTGTSSLGEIFFSGILASVFSASFTRLYEKLGHRYAAMLGAVLGVIWATLMLLWVRWTGSADDYALSSWHYGTMLAIHAAGFAGAALLSALITKQSTVRSVIAGALLASMMTAIPYGVIAWIDQQIAGPIEIVALVSAEVPANESPLRRSGAEIVKLKDDELKLLKEKWLVVKGSSEYEVLDEQGRRYWPLWRKRFIYPGNPSGEVRRLFVLIPAEFNESGSWFLPLSPDPTGVSLVQLDKKYQTKPPHSSFVSHVIQCEWVIESTTPMSAQIKITRTSPIGNFYLPDPVKRDCALQFPTVEISVDSPKDTLPPGKTRPRFDQNEVP